MIESNSCRSFSSGIIEGVNVWRFSCALYYMYPWGKWANTHSRRMIMMNPITDYQGARKLWGISPFPKNTHCLSTYNDFFPWSVHADNCFLSLYTNTVEPLLWAPLFRDTSIQGTEKRQKNVRIIFVFVTSSEVTPLYRGKGHFCRIQSPFRGHLSTWKVTDSHNGNNFHYRSYIKLMYCTCRNSTHNIAEIS